MYKKYIKKPLDIILALIGIIFLLIPMAIIAIAIKLESKGPVIFKQERTGKGEKPFTVLKFRSMCNNAYEMGGIATREDDSRITKVGAFLRKTSLDETPQLFNIIAGKMAIIGPRPILKWEFDEYRNVPEYIKRFDVLPGMFCTVDVDYRASASRELQFEMDAQYSQNITFSGDAKCFFGIIRTVICGSNVYRETDNKNNK